MKPDEITVYTHLLAAKPSDKGIKKTLRLELLQKGVLISLAQDGSPEAVSLLKNALVCIDEPVCELALSVLDHLASRGNQTAVDVLCQAAIEDNPLQAQTLVVSKGYAPSTPEAASLLFLLTGQMEKLNAFDPDLNFLTSSYPSASDETRKRILSSARKKGLDDWALVISTIQTPTPQALSVFSQAFPHFKTEKIKTFGLNEMGRLVRLGNKDVGETLCLVFNQTGEAAVGELAVSLGVCPVDQVQRSLFYFLSSQWSQYELLDFNHSLLSIAYETADKPVRQRIIGQARRIGHLEWGQALSGARRIRWIGDLADSDWELALSALKQAEKWDDLWRLAQLSPPVWSVRALLILGQAKWLPGPDELSLYDQLNHIGANCFGTLPVVLKKSTLTGHLQDITCMALASGKPLLASGSSDQSIRIWDIQRGQMSDILNVNHGQIRSLAFSPDGENLAIGTSDNSIQVYRLADHRLIKVFEGHTAMVRGLAFSPDGWLIASASFDHTLRLWRFPSGPELKRLTGHTSEVFCLSISANGHILASAGADHVVRLWSLPDGTFLKALEGHTNTITCLATSQDSQFMASGGRDNTIILWNLPDGRLRNTFEPQKNIITCLGFHPDGQVLGSGSLDGSLTLWSTSTARPWSRIAGHQGAVTGLAFSQDGGTLVSSGNDRVIHIWALEDLLLARLPIEQIKLARLNQAALSQEKGHPVETNKQWREYTKTLVQWKQRYDIELDEEPQRISAGEFDIEL
jgi:WD40 repeat protein